MKIEKINLGKEIRKVVDDKMGNYSKFAEKLGKSRQNVNNQIFNNSSLNTDLLLQISEILGFNFFELYKNIDTDTQKKEDKPKINVTLEIELTKDELLHLGIEDKIKKIIY